MQTTVQRKTSSKNRLNPGGRYWIWYILPALLMYCLFMAYPMLDSVRLSLYEGTTGARTFVGFANYVRLFTDPEVSARFWGAFRNTWVFFAYHMLVQNVLGMLFAVPLLGEGLDAVSVGFGLAVMATVLLGRRMPVRARAPQG